MTSSIYLLLIFEYLIFPIDFVHVFEALYWSLNNIEIQFEHFFKAEPACGCPQPLPLLFFFLLFQQAFSTPTLWHLGKSKQLQTWRTVVLSSEDGPRRNSE